MLSALISPAGKILRLEMQGMCVANPLQLDLDLLDERGVQIGRTLFATVNRLP